MLRDLSNKIHALHQSECSGRFAMLLLLFMILEVDERLFQCRGQVQERAAQPPPASFENIRHIEADTEQWHLTS